MNEVKGTYFFIRVAEELFGNPLQKGDRLTYREDSRFSSIDPIFDLPPGTICEVLDVEYDPAEPGNTEDQDYNPWDNHYYYHLRGLDEHGRLDTTEIVALFDPVRRSEGFDSIAEQIKQLIEESLLSESD